MRKRSHLVENVAATAIKLTPEEMRILEPLAAAVQGIAVERIEARSMAERRSQEK